VEHATHLDIAKFTTLIVTLYEVAATIALTELDRSCERLDTDLERTDGLEKDVI
jgi:hypothetical protein